MKRKWSVLLLYSLIILSLCFGLVYSGIIWPNDFFAQRYSVCGVDVSKYQGEIDWQILSAQNIDFAFIKATEGSSHVDERFVENWAGAWETKLRVGAYHFFSFDSSGKTQAENFISNVPKTDRMLPPVVDIEFYGTYFDQPAKQEVVRGELHVMLDALEAHYGIKPILYSIDKPYELYLQGEFDNYDLWIRNVLTSPGKENWVFWQYSHRERLNGYSGEEYFIDMNVFRGNRVEFARYGI